MSMNTQETIDLSLRERCNSAESLYLALKNWDADVHLEKVLDILNNKWKFKVFNNIEELKNFFFWDWEIESYTWSKDKTLSDFCVVLKEVFFNRDTPLIKWMSVTMFHEFTKLVKFPASDASLQESIAKNVTQLIESNQHEKLWNRSLDGLTQTELAIYFLQDSEVVLWNNPLDGLTQTELEIYLTQNPEMLFWEEWKDIPRAINESLLQDILLWQKKDVFVQRTIECYRNNLLSSDALHVIISSSNEDTQIELLQNMPQKSDFKDIFFKSIYQKFSWKNKELFLWNDNILTNLWHNTDHDDIADFFSSELAGYIKEQDLGTQSMLFANPRVRSLLNFDEARIIVSHMTPENKDKYFIYLWIWDMCMSFIKKYLKAVFFAK